MNIKLQHLRICDLAVDPKANLCRRRAGATRRQNSSAERERRQ
jgi:hypothetical protein